MKTKVKPKRQHRNKQFAAMGLSVEPGFRDLMQAYAALLDTSQAAAVKHTFFAFATEHVDDALRRGVITVDDTSEILDEERAKRKDSWDATYAAYARVLTLIHERCPNWTAIRRKEAHDATLRKLDEEADNPNYIGTRAHQAKVREKLGLQGEPVAAVVHMTDLESGEITMESAPTNN